MEELKIDGNGNPFGGNYSYYTGHGFGDGGKANGDGLGCGNRGNNDGDGYGCGNDGDGEGTGNPSRG